MNDPIGDLLTRIRNAQMRDRKEVVVPAAKILVAIAKILTKEKFIGGYEVVEGKVDAQKDIKITLRYVDGESAIRGSRRISKPGVRIYLGFRDIKKILGGQGLSILTTSRGLMTGHEARKEKVGGEVLCEIW